MIIETRAYARAGFLGNPSDGYNGKTISISVRNFGAHVSLYQTPELRIEPQIQDRNEYKNINDLTRALIRAAGEVLQIIGPGMIDRICLRGMFEPRAGTERHPH